MLKEKELVELRNKMASGYAQKVINAYNMRFKKSISRATINRFFKGKTYSEELHQAILDVALIQQSLLQKTTEVINA